jgi:hypothetical protein
MIFDVALITTLPIRYRELISFTLDNHSNDTSLLCPASSAFALQLDQIETLSLDTLDRAALEHLSRLPSLRTLTLRIPEKRDLGPPSLSLMAEQTNPFPALSDVQFPVGTIEYAIEFVNMLSDCPLEEFWLGTDVLATNITTGRLYSTLATHVSHTTLCTLTIGEVGDSVNFTPVPPAGAIANYVINGPTLAALFCFRNLTSVHLESPVGFNLDDATALDMARAWTKIRFLTVESCTERLEPRYPTGMTLHGLRAFAKYCEELTWLRITVDASTVPPFDRSPETRISQRRLTSFDVAASPISEPRDVARFLSGLFPRLSEIHTLQDWRWEDLVDVEDDEETADARAQYTRWKQVEALVPMIVAIREEERHWAGMDSE